MRFWRPADKEAPGKEPAEKAPAEKGWLETEGPGGAETAKGDATRGGAAKPDTTKGDTAKADTAKGDTAKGDALPLAGAPAVGKGAPVPAALAAPQEMVIERLTVPAVQVDEATREIREVATLPRAQICVLDIAAGAVVPHMLWVDKGNAVAVLEKAGILHKITVPGLKETGRLEVGAACAGLGLCRAGLLVLVTGSQEVWLLDEASLEVRKRIPVGACDRMASGAGLPIAFVYGREEEFLVLDPARGEVLRTLKPRELIRAQWDTARKPPKWQSRPSCSEARITPTGDLLVQDSIAFARFRITGSAIACEEAGPRETLEPFGASQKQKFPNAYCWVADPAGTGFYAVDDYRDLIFVSRGGAVERVYPIFSATKKAGRNPLHQYETGEARAGNFFGFGSMLVSADGNAILAISSLRLICIDWPAAPGKPKP
jgi:hypothetical protein